MFCQGTQVSVPRCGPLCVFSRTGPFLWATASDSCGPALGLQHRDDVLVVLRDLLAACAGVQVGLREGLQLGDLSRDQRAFSRFSGHHEPAAYTDDTSVLGPHHRSSPIFRVSALRKERTVHSFGNCPEGVYQ
jgi:hypothetical protein